MREDCHQEHRGGLSEAVAAAATSARTAATTMPVQTASWRRKTLKSLMEKRMAVKEAGISVINRGEKWKKETDQEEEQEEREREKR